MVSGQGVLVLQNVDPLTGINTRVEERMHYRGHQDLIDHGDEVPILQAPATLLT